MAKTTPTGRISKRKQPTYTEPVVHQTSPVMWKSAPDEPLSRQCWQDEAERRAILMAEFPQCFEEAVELADAEEAYQAVKNTKKSDPPTFYAARNRLYIARHAVNRWMSDPTAFSGKTPQNRNYDLVMEKYKRNAQAKHDAFYAPATFTRWLRDQVNHHFVAKHYPERIVDRLIDQIGKRSSLSVYQQAAIQQEITERYRIYAALWRTLQHEGVEAAIREWNDGAQAQLADAARWNSDGATDWWTGRDGKEFEKDVSMSLLPRDLRTVKAHK